MIKVYQNGTDLVNENKEYLNTNKYLSVFFFLDAELLKEVDKINYALKVSKDDKELLAIKVAHYSLLLFGEKECVDELIDYIKKNDYEINSFMCSTELGSCIIDKLKEYDDNFKPLLLMDFMEAKEISEPSADDITIPSIDDLDEICYLLGEFIKDCGLLDKVYKEKILEQLPEYRIYRLDGKIVSMCKICKSTDDDKKIGDVYTRKEYRKKGYGRKVVNYAKNEIINSGKIATLNVDQKNPISNHIYESLGFKRGFSQGVYSRIMNIKLVKLSKEYEKQLVDMVDEWTTYNNNHPEANKSPGAIFKNDCHDFDNYLNNIDYVAPGSGLVPTTTFFCLDVDRNIFVGAANIRHYLNEVLLETGGHIGDGIRPSERKKGYATAMIKLALEECKKMGIDKVLMTCHKKNIGSMKSITNNGGVLENEVMDDGEVLQRYWITL